MNSTLTFYYGDGQLPDSVTDVILGTDNERRHEIERIFRRFLEKHISLGQEAKQEGYYLPVGIDTLTIQALIKGEFYRLSEIIRIVHLELCQKPNGRKKGWAGDTQLVWETGYDPFTEQTVFTLDALGRYKEPMTSYHTPLHSLHCDLEDLGLEITKIEE